MNATTNSTSNTTSDERSAADLEREGEQIRASLDRTLDEIQHRFSSGELMDRSMEFLRDNGMEFLREAGETVRRNPVPVLLTAAGLVWLTASVVRSRSDRQYGGEYRGNDEEYLQRDYSQSRTQYGSQYESQEYGTQQYASQSGSSYSGGNGHGHERSWDGTSEGRLRHAAQKVKGGVKGATQRMRGRMAGVKDRVSDRLSGSMESVHGRTQNLGSTFSNLVQEQPLALGALALAAGALLGAALPMTQSEHRWVGPMHDRTMRRAKEVGEREYRNIRQAVASSRKDRSSENRTGSERGPSEWDPSSSTSQASGQSAGQSSGLSGEPGLGGGSSGSGLGSEQRPT